MNFLILGATSDMAKATVDLLSKESNHFYLAARDVNRLLPFKKDLEIRNNTSVKLLEFDSGNYQEHKTFYHQLEPKPDCAISFVGYLGDQKVAEENWEESEKIIKTNFTGVVSILNIAAQDMGARGNGIIVGVSSVAGERGRSSNYLYGSAKAGFTAYLSGLRNRLHPKGVHVLTVKPGFVYTQMTEELDLPKPITANPEQVAKAIITGIKKKKNVIYILPIWRLIMFIIRNIPEMIFKKLKL